ncbi:hypothetical protein EE612_019477 [Oryza sativa]|nr:hypothetical protein EE612_019477 [Oryza sativa]
MDRSMARRRRGTSFTASWQLGLAVVVAAIMASSAQPQQQQQQPPQPPGQPANAPSCPPVQASLSPCVSYFIGNSSTPSDACCEQMRAMFQSQAPCLCAAVASAPSPLAPVLGGVQSLLPTACNLPPNACAGKPFVRAVPILTCGLNSRTHGVIAVAGVVFADATGSTSGSAPAGGSSATPSTGATAAAPGHGARWHGPGDDCRWWIQVSAGYAVLGGRRSPWWWRLCCRRRLDLLHACLCLYDLRCMAGLIYTRPL